MRELLDRRILSELGWSDTRDMTADGLTKGTIDHAHILALMKRKLPVLQAEPLLLSPASPVERVLAMAASGSPNQFGKEFSSDLTGDGLPS